MLYRAVLAIAALSAVIFSGTALGRTHQNFAYPLDDIYSTALRFVRIDRGCTITERDPQAAYILFECKEDRRLRHGALELVRTGPEVRVQLNLLDEPSYMEQRFLELLSRKLREERGVPRPPPPPPPPPQPPPRSPPDGGAS